MWVRNYFFQEILEFEVGQYHSNQSLQHFLASVFRSGELLDWLKRRDKSKEGFNNKELFLRICASLFLVKQL